MPNDILQLGDSVRRIRSAHLRNRPEFRELRADYERQIADRDAQIAALSAEIKRLREENAALKDEINTNRVQNEPAPKKKKAARE